MRPKSRKYSTESGVGRAFFVRVPCWRQSGQRNLFLSGARMYAPCSAIFFTVAIFSRGANKMYERSRTSVTPNNTLRSVDTLHLPLCTCCRPYIPIMATAGNVSQAAQETTRFTISTAFESVATGVMEVGASTPVVAPLCAALLKAKGIVDGA